MTETYDDTRNRWCTGDDACRCGGCLLTIAAARTPEPCGCRSSRDEGSTSLLLLSALVPVLLAVVFLARLLAEVSVVAGGLR